MSGLDLPAELARTHADIPTIFITAMAIFRGL
jgi:FixJ family two-component response regulator